jgi:hypothetical protein
MVSYEPIDEDEAEDLVPQCPYCDYAAESVDSVRGHIRAKTTGKHKGKSGFETDDPDMMQPVRLVDKEQAKLGAEQGNAEQSNAEQPEQGKDDGPEPEDEDGGLGAAMLIGAAILIWWLAQKTGNQNQLQNRYGSP